MNRVRKKDDKCHDFEKFAKKDYCLNPGNGMLIIERLGEMCMNRVVDNIILLMLGIALVFWETDTTALVLALLFAFITAALGVYFTEGRKFLPVGAAFFILCFLLPELAVFLPILLYYVFQYAKDQQSRFLWTAVCAVPFLAAWSAGKYGEREIFLWLVLCGLAILLSHRTNKVETLQQEMIRMRDASTELNLALREKNKSLREKQDYEIYLATLRERNRIAREIHDNVGHMLSRSILQVGALGTVYKKEETLHEQLMGINDTLNQAMNSIRESVHDLHDDSVDLRQAVEEITRTMQEKYTVRIDYDMSKTVPRNVKYCFITTIKEAMSNVVKHSDADKIELVLREHPGFYQLFIGDNGSCKSKMAEDGIGLVNMRERVAALNGTIHITHEQGFKIFISVKKDACEGVLR